MKTVSMRRRLLVSSFAAALACIFSAVAASPGAAFPDRPLKLVIPDPPGGGTDILGRAVTDYLANDLKQPVVAENKPGANTIIAAEYIARSAPDGYTLFVAAGSNMVLNPLMYRKLPYDPARDFRLLSVVTELPLLMVVNPDVPAKTVAEFVAHARQHGDKISYASSGIGGPLHLSAELFKDKAGVKMTHVPYKGSQQALADLLGGRVQVMFDPISTSMPHVRAGKLRALGVGTAERASVLPDVPTVAESGFPDYRAMVWFGVVAPKAVPEPVAQRLREGLNKMLADKDFRDRLSRLGFVVKQPHDEKAVAQFLDEDRARWSTVIKAHNITLD
jgi:tripartite-type tricarboxylate transporter receptor subunit TctC